MNREIGGTTVKESDAAYREVLTSYVDESHLQATFEQRYGRGWQRGLGAVLDVPESTVNGWFRSGKFPALAKLAFGVLLSRPMRPSQNWMVAKTGATYAVWAIEAPMGRVVADNISSLEDAELIAAAPLLRESACRAYDALCDNGLEELPETVSLNAAIDAASPPA